MIGSLIFAPLLASAMAGQEITPLDDGRFKVTIVYTRLTVEGHMEAQIAIANAANKACKGKGRAVSEGTLEVNNAVSPRGRGKALSLSEVYRCVPNA